MNLASSYSRTSISSRTSSSSRTSFASRTAQLTIATALVIAFAAIALAGWSGSAAAQFGPDPDDGTLYLQVSATGDPDSAPSIWSFDITSTCVADRSAGVGSSWSFDPFSIAQQDIVFSTLVNDDGSPCQYTITPEATPGFTPYPASIDFAFVNGPYADASADFTFIGTAPTGTLNISTRAWDITQDQYALGGGNWPHPDTWTYETLPASWDYELSSPCLPTDQFLSVSTADTPPELNNELAVNNLPFFDAAGNLCEYTVLRLPNAGWIIREDRNLEQTTALLPHPNDKRLSAIQLKTNVDVITLAGRSDGWVQVGNTRNWVSAACRAELESAGAIVGVVEWPALAALADASPFQRCDGLIADLFGDDSPRIVTLAGRSDGWVQVGNTRNWVSATCRSQLVAAGASLDVVEWTRLAALNDATPFQSCNGLYDDLFGDAGPRIISMLGRSDGWVFDWVNGVATRNWVDASCRQRLISAGAVIDGTFGYVDWPTLSSLVDANPFQRCDALLLNLYR